MWSGFWWYLGIAVVIIAALALVLKRRGSSGGSIGHNTPGSEGMDLGGRGGTSGPTSF